MELAFIFLIGVMDLHKSLWQMLGQVMLQLKVGYIFLIWQATIQYLLLTMEAVLIYLIFIGNQHLQNLNSIQTPQLLEH